MNDAMKSVILIEPEEANLILNLIDNKDSLSKEVEEFRIELQKKVMIAQGIIPLDNQK